MATASLWVAGEVDGSASVMVVLARDQHANGMVSQFPPILGCLSKSPPEIEELLGDRLSA